MSVPIAAEPSALPIAVRAYAVRTAPEAGAGGVPPRRAAAVAYDSPEERWPGPVLLFDCETTTDETQRLTFGAYRCCRWTASGALRCVEEGLFHADELPEEDPEGFAVLQAYAQAHAAGTEGAPPLRLRSRREFMDGRFWQISYEAQGLVVGFNLPFDLSRVALKASEARGDRFRGGFSFQLWDYFDKRTGTRKENTFRPRLRIKSIDSKRAFYGYGAPKGPRERGTRPFQGHFLDLRTLAFALTSRGHSLRSACEAFSVVEGKGTAAEGHGHITPAYVDYCRQDVRATEGLLGALRAEFDRHPIDLAPTKAFSPASIAKAYLRAMGLTPPAVQFRATVTPEVMGYAMSAYYGGRAECRIRKTPVPVVYTDFLSMYPTVNALMDLWDVLTAERLDVVDATEELRALLATVTTERCFEPNFWRELRVFALIQPDGDILPVRAQYSEASDSYNIGVNPLTSGTPLWYAGPDLVASTLLTGKPPRVRRAFRLVPHGRQASMRAVRLRGRVAVDPTRDDFFRSVIEERTRVRRDSSLSPDEREHLQAFLRVLANSGSYGVYAEMNREELPKGERVTVRVFGAASPFECATSAPEDPGPYCFPPIAALIPSAARLMLALLEACVRDLGGTYAFCDTDSLAIVAAQERCAVERLGASQQTLTGENAVPALSWKQVEALAERFAHLNPYDDTAVRGSILKIEGENYDEHGAQRELWCYMVSAKRYALYTTKRGEVTIAKASEHGLGHLLVPCSETAVTKSWIYTAWEVAIRAALGMPYGTPGWLERPAVSRITVSNPTLLRPFLALNTGKPYRLQVKPMNFLLSATVARLGHPVGVAPNAFHLVLPFDANAAAWTKRTWTNRYSGATYRVTTAPGASAGTARLCTYQSVLEQHRNHAETKSAGMTHGRPFGGQSEGLLHRRCVRLRGPSLYHIGKESNRLEEVEHGAVQSWDHVVGRYPSASNWRNILRDLLSTSARAQVAARLGVSVRTVSAWKSGSTTPSASAIKRIVSLFAN